MDGVFWRSWIFWKWMGFFENPGFFEKDGVWNFWKPGILKTRKFWKNAEFYNVEFENGRCFLKIVDFLKMNGFFWKPGIFWKRRGF